MAEKEAEFYLTCSAFGEGGHIPRKHTGDGPPHQHDRSPPLAWHNVPEGTETLALVVDDPDAPDPEAPIVPWTHWVIFNIPASLKGLPAGFSSKDVEGDEQYGELQEGYNDFKVPGYRGPSPPKGVHHYEFRLYALDTTIRGLGKKATKEKLEEEMEGHILGQCTLTGTFHKEKTGHDTYMPRSGPYDASGPG
eukprot:SM000316S12297  [mRNA]  locus=s316:54126:55422:+ [translate_table: standard]